MKRILISLGLALATSLGFAGTGPGSAASVDLGVTTSALTTANTLLTTFTLSTVGTNPVTAVHLYVDVTALGSVTSVIVTPAGAKDGNPTSTGYYGDQSNLIRNVMTETAVGRYHMRVPANEFGAYNNAGFFMKIGGTNTSSSLSAAY